MTKLLAAASSEELALLAIGGFAGLRMAEIKRLDWKAVDLERRIIMLRADQAGKQKGQSDGDRERNAKDKCKRTAQLGDYENEQKREGQVGHCEDRAR